VVCFTVYVTGSKSCPLIATLNSGGSDSALSVPSSFLASMTSRGRRLKDEKVAGLDNQVDRLELLVVLVPRAHLAVEAAFGAAFTGDGALKVCLGRGLVRVVFLENCSHARGGADGVLVVCAVNQVLELVAPQVPCFNAEDKTDVIHKIGFACAVRPDDGRERRERPDRLPPFVGLEVLQLEP